MVSLLLTLNIFTPCYSVSIGNSEKVNADWVVHIKILSENDVNTKPQLQSPCSFVQIPLYITLLTRNSIPSKTVFTCSQLHIELSQNFLL